jgi:outer membrane protein W
MQSASGVVDMCSAICSNLILQYYINSLTTNRPFLEAGLEAAYVLCSRIEAGTISVDLLKKNKNGKCGTCFNYSVGRKDTFLKRNGRSSVFQLRMEKRVCTG